MFVVTGGAGFIGSNLVRALSERGAAVCVVDAPDADGRRNLNGVRVDERLAPDEFLALVRADDAWLRGVEGVLHQGACADTAQRDLAYLLRNNDAYGRPIASWCVERGIPFVYASSAAVYGRGRGFAEEAACEAPLNPYAVSKLSFDRFVRELLPAARSPLVGLRYFNVYGPGEAHKGRMASAVLQFHDMIRARGTALLFEGTDGFGPGEQRRDFVHVEDVVAVNLWFLERRAPSGIYNVGTGRSRTFNDVAQTLIGVLGRGAVAYRPFPEEFRGLYQSHTEADLRALRAAGYSARFRDLEEGIGAYAAWLARPGLDERPEGARPCASAT